MSEPAEQVSSSRRENAAAVVTRFMIEKALWNCCVSLALTEILPNLYLGGYVPLWLFPTPFPPILSLFPFESKVKKGKLSTLTHTSNLYFIHLSIHSFKNISKPAISPPPTSTPSAPPTSPSSSQSCPRTSRPRRSSRIWTWAS